MGGFIAKTPAAVDVARRASLLVSRGLNECTEGSGGGWIGRAPPLELRASASANVSPQVDRMGARSRRKSAAWRSKGVAAVEGANRAPAEGSTVRGWGVAPKPNGWPGAPAGRAAVAGGFADPGEAVQWCSVPSFCAQCDTGDRIPAWADSAPPNPPERPLAPGAASWPSATRGR